MPDTTPPGAGQNTVAESVFSRPDRGARGPIPEHSRAEITSAAIALADSGGLPAATMRAVAGMLGTTAGSLYRYFSSRDELLDLMVDAVLAELRLNREPAGSWLADLVALAEDQLALYRRHPWLLDAGMRGGVIGPHATDYFEDCLRIMAPLPAGNDIKMEAIAMITGVVSLFARVPSAPVRAVDPASVFGSASPDRHPRLVAALSESGRSPARTDMFGRTVRSVLRGLLIDES